MGFLINKISTASYRCWPLIKLTVSWIHRGKLSSTEEINLVLAIARILTLNVLPWCCLLWTILSLYSTRIHPVFALRRTVRPFKHQERTPYLVPYQKRTGGKEGPTLIAWVSRLLTREREREKSSTRAWPEIFWTRAHQTGTFSACRHNFVHNQWCISIWDGLVCPRSSERSSRRIFFWRSSVSHSSSVVYRNRAFISPRASCSLTDGFAVKFNQKIIR